jgi:cobalamin biosynthesis protein CobD/CbiB
VGCRWIGLEWKQLFSVVVAMAENNLMVRMTQAITQLTHVVEQAHERQERDLADHDRRLKVMEDVQRDTREMLQILIARSSG